MPQENQNPGTVTSDSGVETNNVDQTKGSPDKMTDSITTAITNTPAQNDYFNITKIPDYRESLLLQLGFLGHNPEDPIELHMLAPRKGPYAGKELLRVLCEGPDAAVAACVQADKWHPQGTYIQMNQPFRDKQDAYGTNTTWETASKGCAKDHDIECRRAMYFDFDPKKPEEFEKDSATSEERKLAREASKPLYDDLVAKYPNSVAYGSSGNGAQIWLALANLPECPEVAQTVSRLLLAARRLFQSPNAKVDKSVSDARRIGPAFGSMKNKGGVKDIATGEVKQTPDRHWRRTYFSGPSTPYRLTLDDLKAILADWEPRAEKLPPVEDDDKKKGKAKDKDSNTDEDKTEVVTSDLKEELKPFKAIPIRDVADWLGMEQIDDKNYVCPLFKDAKAEVFEKNGQNALKCHHDRCQGEGSGKGCRDTIALTMARKKVKLWEALLFLSDQFGIPMPKGKKVKNLPEACTGAEWESLLHYSPQGQLISKEYNAQLILKHDPRWQNMLQFDEFRNVIQWNSEKKPWDGAWYAATKPRRPNAKPAWKDANTSQVRTWLNENWRIDAGSVSTIIMIAQTNTINPLLDYLEGLPAWEGTKRIDTWLIDYQKSPDTTYTRLVSRKCLIDAVRRAYEPGCVCDEMPIFEGDQGIGKSKMISRGLLPNYDWFLDTLRDIGSAEAGKQLQGKWIVEMKEMDNVFKKEPAEAKAFLDTTVDNFRPSYGWFAQDFPRMCWLYGTVNAIGGAGYLKDPTGNRRYLPVECLGTKEDAPARIDAIAKVRDQLWAEAVHAYKSGEKTYYCDAATIAMVEEEQAARRTVHPWEDKIERYLSDKTFITSEEILEYCLAIPAAQWGHGKKIEIAGILQNLGWKKAKGKTDPITDKRPNGYVRGEKAQPLGHFRVATTPQTPPSNTNSLIQTAKDDADIAADLASQAFGPSFAVARA